MWRNGSGERVVSSVHVEKRSGERVVSSVRSRQGLCRSFRTGVRASLTSLTACDQRSRAQVITGGVFLACASPPPVLTAVGIKPGSL